MPVTHLPYSTYVPHWQTIGRILWCHHTSDKERVQGVESNLAATFLKSTTNFRHNSVGRMGGTTPFHLLSVSPSPIVWTQRLLSESVSQANTPGRFLCQDKKKKKKEKREKEEKRKRCRILDFKAIKAPEGVCQMSVSVIQEKQSENTDACLLSPFLRCLCWGEIGTGASSLQHPKQH